MQIIDREIVHYFDERTLISSKFNRVFWEEDGKLTTIKIPTKLWERVAGTFRIIRRLLRIDKCNVYPVKDGLTIIRKGKVFLFDSKLKTLFEVLKLKNCRNVLHQSIARTPNGYLYFGEYGSNPRRNKVPIYRSTDEGRSWHVIYEFEAGMIRHVHACAYDGYENKIWVCTGDFGTENKIVVSDFDFNEVEFIGDGSQKFRTCNFFFLEEEVHWLMDSQLETSFHFKLNRKNRQITRLSDLPGPVWYSKATSLGYFATTAQERGIGVKDRYAHILFSEDLLAWKTIQRYEHDIWPRKYFKSGVIGFSEGNATSSFYYFYEAIKNKDGKSEKHDFNS